MSKLNQLLFNEFTSKLYFKSNDIALQSFKILEKYPKALGFDIETGGFIVLHKKHKAGGLESEIGACLILKNEGFGIELIEEYENEKSLDVMVEGKAFEIKQIVNSSNLRKAVQRHFQRTYLKTGNLILHIVQPIHENQLRGCLKEAADIYPSIKRVWLIYRKKVIKLDRKMILQGNYVIQK